MPRPTNQHDGARSTAGKARPALIERFRRWWDRNVAHPYRPEKHYMRGGRSRPQPAAANDDLAPASVRQSA